VAGIGNLRRIRVAGRDQAVDVGRGRVAIELAGFGVGRRLREIVVFKRDHEDVLDGRSGLGLGGRKERTCRQKQMLFHGG